MFRVFHYLFRERPTATAPSCNSLSRILKAALIVLSCAAPHAAWACACGCSVFEVGTYSLLPTENDHGGNVYFEWDYSNQNHNWSGTSRAPAANNSDKQLETNWYSIGIEYMFNRDWGLMAHLPSATRTFHTQDDPTEPVSVFKDTALGDAVIAAMYTGFSKDMSTGVYFGLKLPTGDFTAPGFDRDTQIGTGSTDLVLGGFNRGLITGDNKWQYFSQLRLQTPLAQQSAFDADLGTDGTYWPGTTVDGSVGIVYNGGYHIAGFDKIAPLIQLIGSYRARDSGTAADPVDTGYERVFISPAVEFTKVLDEKNATVMRVYADVEIPIYQNVNGNQIVAPALFKVVSSYSLP
jgi:hypothetical protein